VVREGLLRSLFKFLFDYLHVLDGLFTFLLGFHSSTFCGNHVYYLCVCMAFGNLCIDCVNFLVYICLMFGQRMQSWILDARNRQASHRPEDIAKISEKTSHLNTRRRCQCSSGPLAVLGCWSHCCTHRHIESSDGSGLNAIV
jgi:hypothetical protein